MKHVSLILTAAAISLAASSQAYADYVLMRWTSGFCQVWDRSFPTKPFPDDFTVGQLRFKTFNDAMVMKMRLVARGQCW